ncbi:MAG TPA: GNAT family N-acetyltransferase [Rubrobacteraceae bacterium]|nr:GNAT family N-acetyltransferase [Rubrobacteraceae bacterium]
MRVGLIDAVEQVGEAAWRPLEPPDFPFFDYEFLDALEKSGSVGTRTGWSPVHLVCEGGGQLVGAMPLYLKTDSYGEYVFDWEWAHAYHQHGVSYYPKLVAAVPFTPATGPRILVRPGADREVVVRALLDAAREVAEENRASSTHALFVPDSDLDEFERRGFAVRHSLQFHWRNRGHASFDDYLGALVSKRRRQISRERRQLAEENLTIERLTGEALGPDHADTMYRFYMATADRKWGSPYLNRAFFREVFRTMKDRLLFVQARDEAGRPIAGTINFYKDSALFGRHWGAVEDRRNLHFELCYYQTIEFAIEREIKLFEAGAQGEHKLARGFLPTLTRSAHDLRHPAFRRAIERFIEEEKDYLDAAVEEYSMHDPYKG